VLISAELTDSAKGTLLWGGHFDRRAGDVLAVQDAIAEAILVEGIGMALTSAQRQRLALAFSGDPTAYELFLLAVHHLRLGSEDDYLTARRLLQRAVERDPRFALAHVTLASSYSVMAIDGYVAPAEAWPESERHVARAIAIDADLADAHAEAAASAFFYRWNWDEAEREWGLALRMRNELQSELLSAYALQKWASGQPRAALELAQAARQVDPLSPQASIREADLLAAVGRVEEAIAAYERVVRELPGDPRAHAGLAEAWRRQGRFDQAIRHLRVAHGGGGPSFDALFERARGAAGYDEIVREAAREELRQLEERRRAGSYVSALDLARAFARLGDAVRAFDQLGAALDERAAGLALLAVDPAWNQLRGDPRFAAAVARVGIPRLVTARAAAATGEGRRSL
jgi:tetratricopeptide (TPR) repeat protein